MTSANKIDYDVEYMIMRIVKDAFVKLRVGDLISDGLSKDTLLVLKDLTGSVSKKQMIDFIREANQGVSERESYVQRI